MENNTIYNNVLKLNNIILMNNNHFNVLKIVKYKI